MSEITIEHAARHDGLVVAGLVLATDRESGATPREGFLAEYADAWLADFDRRPTWLAKQSDGNPIGLLQATVIRKLPSLRRSTSCWVHVSLLFVRPQHRRQGVAERMVQELFTWGEQEGVDRYQLNATPIARSLYARLGFTAPDTPLMERRTSS